MNFSTDIDECALLTHNCRSDAVCSNTLGAYSCTCSTGYEGDGVTSCSGKVQNISSYI